MDSGARKEKPTYFAGAAVLLLLAIHAGLLAYSATRHSPTDMEPALLASGLSHWTLGRFDLYRVNPPLVRMIAAIPALVCGAETDWSRISDEPGSRAEYHVAEDFLRANGERSISLVIWARWVCIPISLLGGWFAYRWSHELYGPWAGVGSVAIWCFEPNLLAHSELITPDTACVSFGIAAGYWYWKWLKQPTIWGALVSGVWLGLALLAKMTWLILFLVWPIVWLAWTFASWRSRMPGPSGAAARRVRLKSSASAPRSELTQLAMMFVVAGYIVNLCYAFDGTFTPLEEFRFVSTLMTGSGAPGKVGNRFVGTKLGVIPVPIPREYLLGFDTQKKDFEHFGQPGYLRGEWSNEGWWYYYVYGLLVKVPCGLWAVFTIVVFLKLFRTGPRIAFRNELPLLAPAIAVALLVSWQRGINHHLRYIHPALGLMCIWLGQAFSHGAIRARWASWLPHLAIGYSIVSMLLTYPHHLAYFNDFVGGPTNGYQHLLGSSVDWGQDLLFLREWEAEHEARIAAYFGGYESAIFRLLHSSAESVKCPARTVRVASVNRVFQKGSRLKPTGERIGLTLWIVE